MNRFSLALLLAFAVPSALAHAASKEDRPPMTIENALDDAEKLLDNGGNASDISTRLHKTHGLTKEEMRRLEVIDARSDLLVGSNAAAEKILIKLHKSAPDDVRISEWYARALDGNGKADSALPLFKELAAKDGLHDGDSYWALAQLEQKSEPKLALEHAKAALTHPIVLQSDALDKEIHKFITDLSKSK
jgi:tetratricopeptide (TPR) repeat protein